MALPASGGISIANINTEYGVATTTHRTFNDAQIRSICKCPTGAVNLNAGHGNTRLSVTCPNGTVSLGVATTLTAVGSGGTGSYSYSIVKNSGITMIGPTQSGASFTFDHSSTGITAGSGDAYYTITVSDGVLTATVAISVHATWSKSGGS